MGPPGGGTETFRRPVIKGISVRHTRSRFHHSSETEASELQALQTYSSFRTAVQSTIRPQAQ